MSRVDVRRRSSRRPSTVAASPRARSGATPIAASTWLDVAAPLEQLDAADAQTPAWSKQEEQLVAGESLEGDVHRAGHARGPDAR